MPELPEVETVRAGLAPHVRGRRITNARVSGKRLRLPWPDDFIRRIEGRRVLALRRRAKFLLWELSGGLWLISHLGMSGRYSVLPPRGKGRALGEFYFHDTVENGAGAHDHLLLVLDDGTRVIYTDPRRFGFFDLTHDPGAHPMLRHLGPEPLSDDFSAAHLAQAFHGRSVPVKNLLLDQRIVAGLGNIYVCEALFHAGISPRRGGASLSPAGRPTARLERLVTAVRDVLAQAIAAGGSTLRDHQQVNGAQGGFQQEFAVYGRAGAPCRICGAPIRRITQSGRGTFYCGNCQR